MCIPVCAYVFICTYTCECAYACVLRLVEARGWQWESFFCGSSLLFWGAGSFSEFGVHLLYRMTGQKAPRTLLGLHLWCWDYGSMPPYPDFCIGFQDTELNLSCMCGKGFTVSSCSSGDLADEGGLLFILSFTVPTLHHFLLAFETSGNQITKMVRLYASRRNSVPYLWNGGWYFL